MRKALSPLLDGIFLLMMAILLTAFAAAFIRQNAESVHGSTGVEIESRSAQIGTIFELESVDKNHVYIRNIGTESLKDLSVFVNNEMVSTNNPTIPAGSVGEIVINDAQLALQPDPADVRITYQGISQEEKSVSFYNPYTLGYWNFDENDTIARDSSGNQNDGIIIDDEGDAKVEGKHNKAVKLDKIDDYVEVPDSPVLNPEGNTLTIEAWIYPFEDFEDMEGWDGIVFKGNFDQSPQYGIVRSDDDRGKIVIYIYNKAGAVFTMPSSQKLLKDRWYHVVGIVDGEQIKLYINGALDNVRADFTGRIKSANSPLYIGKNREGEVFNGIIDEVRILNEARVMSIS